VTVLHESGEPTEVPSPDRLQDGPRSDARQASTDTPRKLQGLLPREGRLRRTYLPDGESTATRDKAPVDDTHRPLLDPLGDLHAVNGAEWSDSHHAVERRADAR